MATVGQRIRELRTQKGITQTELAKDIVTPSMISQIEAGKTVPSQSLVQRIADRLDVPIELLLVPPAREHTVTTLLQVLRACLVTQEYDAAEQLLQEAADAADIHYEAGEMSGLIHLARMRLAAASEAFSRALVLSREREEWDKIPELFIHLGDTYAAAKDWPTALHLYTQAQRATERFPRAHGILEADVALRLSRAHHALGNASQAWLQATAARDRIALGDDALRAIKERARHAAQHARLGEDELARKLAREVTTMTELMHWLEARVEAYLIQIDQLQAADQWLAAKALLEEVMANSGSHMSAHERARFTLAKARLLAKQLAFDEAVTCMKEALASVPPTCNLLDQALLVCHTLQENGAATHVKERADQLVQLGETVGWSLAQTDAKLWLTIQETPSATAR